MRCLLEFERKRSAFWLAVPRSAPPNPRFINEKVHNREAI